MRRTSNATRRPVRGIVLGLIPALAVATASLIRESPVLAAEPAEKSLPSTINAFEFGCGPYRYVDLPKIDYRLKNVTPEGKQSIWNLDHYHNGPAREEMSKANPYAHAVMSNIDFTLRHSPNHPDALSMLIDYKLRGGDLLKFATVDCYLEWAHRFAPDDSVVLGFGGRYFERTGNSKRAEAWYKAAVDLDPSSAETHYNFGLFYFKAKQYELAREQARVAYSLGYPLPGLKDLLAKQGYAIGNQ